MSQRRTSARIRGLPKVKYGEEEKEDHRRWIDERRNKKEKKPAGRPAETRKKVLTQPIQPAAPKPVRFSLSAAISQAQTATAPLSSLEEEGPPPPVPNDEQFDIYKAMNRTIEYVEAPLPPKGSRPVVLMGCIDTLKSFIRDQLIYINSEGPIRDMEVLVGEHYQEFAWILAKIVNSNCSPDTKNKLMLPSMYAYNTADRSTDIFAAGIIQQRGAFRFSDIYAVSTIFAELSSSPLNDAALVGDYGLKWEVIVAYVELLFRLLDPLNPTLLNEFLSFNLQLMLSLMSEASILNSFLASQRKLYDFDLMAFTASRLEEIWQTTPVLTMHPYSALFPHFFTASHVRFFYI